MTPTARPVAPGLWTIEVDGETLGTITEHRRYGPGNRPVWHYTYSGPIRLQHSTYRSRDALLDAVTRSHN